LDVEIPGEYARYVVEKGSVAIDGISLTVTESPGAVFGVAIIPHTLANTTLEQAQARSVGERRDGHPGEVRHAPAWQRVPERRGLARHAGRARVHLTEEVGVADMALATTGEAIERNRSR
jgi:uncharacterized protein YdbL (DUF1318 family)